MPKTHELKTWPTIFAAIADGTKTFEFRRDDRGFNVGDTLVLREYAPDKESYSHRRLEAAVTYILRGPAFGVPADFCVMSIKLIEEAE